MAKLFYRVVKSRLRILFLSSWYPNREIPTLGNFIQRHAEAVARLHDVQVVYIYPSDKTKGWFEISDSVEHGIQTTIVYYKKGVLAPVRQWIAFRKACVYLEKQKRFSFDLIHHNVFWKMGWQARYLHDRKKIPYIVTEHWTGFDLQTRPEKFFLLKYIVRYAAKSASFICPVSENLAETMRRFGIQGRYKVIPNVVDTSIFTLEHKASDTIRFLHVSTLNDDHKNISGILRVWKKASEIRKDIHLEIGGDGPWEKFRRIAEELNIPSDSIRFFGEQSWSEVAEKMKKSHALLMFSNYENLPCVIVEALASGMTVISTRVGGISEHIDASRGILVDKKDEEALLAAILNTAGTASQTDRQSLRRYAVEHFSMEHVCAAYDAVYRTSLSSH